MILRTFAPPSPLALAALAFVAAIGCSSGSDSGSPAQEHPTVIKPYIPDPSDASAAEDAPDATPAAAPIQGNPLCNASHFSGPCYPDDPANPKSCGPGPGGAAYNLQATLACHVVVVSAEQASANAVPGVMVEPTCSLPGAGSEGAPCTESTDCSATNECVGAGTCRRYCCGGDTACLPDEFCDTKPLVETPGTMVPVCMPIHACGLLDDSDAGTCSATETCAVVRDQNGSTGCVPVGSARAGESCETAYCGRGLTCIGTWTRHICYTLCHTGAPVECSSGQACMGELTVFPDPAFGICE
jgi:hypothetical protein